MSTLWVVETGLRQITVMAIGKSSTKDRERSIPVRSSGTNRQDWLHSECSVQWPCAVHDLTFPLACFDPFKRCLAHISTGLSWASLEALAFPQLPFFTSGHWCRCWSQIQSRITNTHSIMIGWAFLVKFSKSHWSCLWKRISRSPNCAECCWSKQVRINAESFRYANLILHGIARRLKMAKPFKGFISKIPWRICTLIMGRGISTTYPYITNYPPTPTSRWWACRKFRSDTSDLRTSATISWRPSGTCVATRYNMSELVTSGDPHGGLCADLFSHTLADICSLLFWQSLWQEYWRTFRHLVWHIIYSDSLCVIFRLV